MSKQKMIWMAFMSSPILLSVVGFMLHGEFQYNYEGLINHQAAIILTFVAFASATGSLVFSNIRSTVQSRGQSDQKDFTKMVVNLAIAESVAVYGLVVTIITQQNYMFLFAVLSLFAMIQARPR